MNMSINRIASVCRNGQNPMAFVDKGKDMFLEQYSFGSICFGVSRGTVPYNYGNIGKNAGAVRFLNGASLSYEGVSTVNKKMKTNIDKVLSFLDFHEGWNGNRGKAFSDVLLKKIVTLLSKLPFQPEVFPVEDGSVQLEYEKETGEYLEYEIRDDLCVTEFSIDVAGNESERCFGFDEETIKKQVAAFYG